MDWLTGLAVLLSPEAMTVLNSLRSLASFGFSLILGGCASGSKPLPGFAEEGLFILVQLILMPYQHQNIGTAYESNLG